MNKNQSQYQYFKNKKQNVTKNTLLKKKENQNDIG